MRILIVDDEPRFAAVLGRTLACEGFPEVITAASGEEALARCASDDADLVVTDLRMPRMDGLALLSEVRRRHPETRVVLMTAFADVATARAALKCGALDYLVKPFETSELVALVRQVAAQTEHAPAERLVGLIGESPPMRQVFAHLRRAAASDATVLLLGESGTGKELAAQAIHRLGARRERPFVELHIAALAEGILESELFGHEPGAFTGAQRRRRGLIEHADHGTLFLDEIGEVPSHVQAKILRVLQERRFHRVGGAEPVTVDVRVVAATNRDLAAEVRAGRFREDLFWRLDVLAITLPPLRERPGDVRLLALHFAAERGLEVDAQALAALEAYRWPGNVRELVNAIERAAVLGAGDAILRDHLPARVLGLDPTPTNGAPIADNLHLGERERDAILTALRQAEGNKAHAARILGITRRRLYSRLRVLGLDGGAEEG